MTVCGHDSDQTQWHGITLSSFNTLSFDPVPLITFNVKFPSAAGEAAQRTRLIVMNILRPHHLAAQLGDRFSKPSRPLSAHAPPPGENSKPPPLPQHPTPPPAFTAPVPGDRSTRKLTPT